MTIPTEQETKEQIANASDADLCDLRSHFFRAAQWADEEQRRRKEEALRIPKEGKRHG